MGPDENRAGFGMSISSLSLYPIHRISINSYIRHGTWTLSITGASSQNEMTYKNSLETNEEPVDLNSKLMGSWSQKFWGRQFSDMYHIVSSCIFISRLPMDLPKAPTIFVILSPLLVWYKCWRRTLGMATFWPHFFTSFNFTQKGPSPKIFPGW